MHAGLVCKIETLYPIEIRPGVFADQIQRATVHGYTVIVGKDYIVGQLGVFFLGGDIQLSQEFAEANNLLVIRDEYGKKIGGGYLEADRRLRIVKLLGVKSDGIFCPLSYFDFVKQKTNKTFTLVEDDQFDTLHGIIICQRAPLRQAKLQKENQRALQKLKRRFGTVCFAQHMSTSHLRSEINKIPVGALLYITAKLHGTSGRTGNVIVNIAQYSILQRLVEKIYQSKYVNRYCRKILDKYWDVGPKNFKSSYQVISGTRQTIIEPTKPITGYYKDNFRKTVEQKYFAGKLHKGEVVYYEIVGFQENGKPLMQSQPLAKLKDKKLEQYYGQMMNYNYACKPGECEVYVYRITTVNEDGHAIELSWPQVKARCTELNVKYVPQVATMPIRYDGDKEKLLEICEQYVDCPSIVDPTHIEEGVCVRIEYGYQINILKHKGFLFRVLESNAKEDENYEDIEETQDSNEVE